MRPRARLERPATGPGHYLRDLVYGATDGVITTTAIVAGVVAAGLPPGVAVVLGLANIVADGLSMGASNYLGLKSELEQTGRSVAEEKPARHGLATLVAFVAAGAVPLVAFVVPRPAGLAAFPLALVLSAATLLGVGAARGAFIPKPRWRLAAEMLLVGGAAAGAAFLIGGAASPLLTAFA